MSIKIVWVHKKSKNKKWITDFTEDITQTVSKVVWSGADTQASRSLVISVVNNPYDKNTKAPNIVPGDIIKLYKDKEKNPRFIGRAVNRSKVSDLGTIDVTCYDYMHNLIKSTGTYKFKNKTPEFIAKSVLKDVKITAGTLKKTNTKIKKYYPSNASLYNIIMKAYKKVVSKTKVQYMPRMNGTKFEVIEKGKVIESIMLSDNVDIYQSRYEENSDNVIDKVIVYKKNKKVGTYKRDANIQRYGIIQKDITVDSGKGKKQADSNFKGMSKTASISAIGAWACISGKGVYIHDSASGLIGTYWIINDKHTFENGIHKMDLDLAFKNVTENPNVSQTSDKKKKTTGKNSSEDKVKYTYKKKPATFTAYYPGENGEWLDSHDRRLVAAKMTCAASRSIAFNTKIIVKDTKTKYDGKTYKVTDRPATKYDMMDGRLHIDLLLNDKAECDAFGRRHGKIAIKKKVKDKDSKKMKKLIKEAKYWVGKLSYSQANRQNFRPGGSADCSSFAHHCFAKIGIEIGSTTDDQPRAGKEVSKKKRKKGDLVFFHTCSDRGQPYGATHVGICLSKKKFVHCSSSRNGVVITRFSSYTPPLVAVRRVLNG